MHTPGVVQPIVVGVMGTGVTTLVKPRIDVARLPSEIKSRLSSLKADAPATLRHLYEKDGHWLWVLVPLLILTINVYKLNWDSWFNPDQTLDFQPFVPLAIGFVLLLQRSELIEIYNELIFIYPEDSPKLHGRSWLVILGCGVLLTAIFSALPTLAILGFIITIVGSVYFLYGPVILKTVWLSLFFLLLMIPPPVSLLIMALSHLQVGIAVVAGQVLQLFDHDVRVQGAIITMSAYQVEVTPACSGLSVAFPVLMLTGLMTVVRRTTQNLTLIVLIEAAVISLLVNVLRVVAVGLVGNANPDVAQVLRDCSPFFLIVVAFYLTYLASRPILNPRRRLSEFEQDLLISTQVAEGVAAASEDPQ